MKRVFFGILVLSMLSAVIPNARGDSGFLYSGGVFTTINVPDAYATYASGINNAGQIVCDTGNQAGPTGGFVDANGVFTMISSPGVNSNSIEPTGTNDVGQVIGIFNDGSSAFLDNNGAFTTISIGTNEQTVPNGINNLGQVVGFYRGASTAGPPKVSCLMVASSPRSAIQMPPVAPVPTR